MKILLDDIRESPKALAYAESVEELNTRLGRGVRDFRVPRDLGVEVEYDRSGLEVFFRGALHGEVLGTCARCLEEYAFRLDRPFAFVVVPRSAAILRAGQLKEDDIALSYYDGAEIDLTPHVYEEAMLALPTRALCTEECRGLCPRCGANLNLGPCACPAAETYPLGQRAR
jgi:uncharacterized protein